MTMTRRQTIWRTRAKGLTLIEILLAMGLLTILLAMIGSVFPVAFTQARESREETFGVLVAENAIATCTTVLSDNDLSTYNQLTMVPIGENAGDLLDPDDCAYNPQEATVAPYKWVALARRLSDASVQLIVVPYQTFGDPATRVVANPLSVDSFDPSATVKWMEFSGSNIAQALQEGAPVIDRATGRFAFIAAADPANNRAIVSNDFGGTTPSQVFVVGLPIADVPAAGGARSPTIYAMMVQTALAAE